MGNYQGLVPLTHQNHYKAGSIVLITGASSGLGRQLAIVYSKKKAKLLITGRNKERLEQTKQQCVNNGAIVLDFVTDITKEQQCRNLVSFCINRFGGLDVLILNAGINAHFDFPTLKDTSIVEQLMRTNYYACVYLTKQAFPYLKKNKGQIVVISSMSGKIGTPSRSAYCASKFATTGFFEALKTEDLGVDITTVYPPSLDTPMRDHDLLASKSDKKHQNPNEKREDPRTSAEIIAMAADHRVQHMYFPLKPYLAAYLSPFFPQTIRNKVKMAAKL